MGKVEDDRRRGFVLEVLFKGEVAFKDTDGCGYRTDERVIYRPASSRRGWEKEMVEIPIEKKLEFCSEKNSLLLSKYLGTWYYIYNNKD